MHLPTHGQTCIFGKNVSKDSVGYDVKKFRIRKVFYADDMPLDIQCEICEECRNGFAVRVALSGYDSYPLSRKWLLENGALESDQFVFVWIEW